MAKRFEPRYCPVPGGILRNVVRCLSALIFAAAVAAGCGGPFGQRGKVRTQHRSLTDPAQVATIDHKSPFLKAHMRNGDVYILSPWSVDATARTVSGNGERLDPNRTRVGEGAHVIPLDSVALFETNVVSTTGRSRRSQSSLAHRSP